MYHDNLPADAGVSVHTGFQNPAIDASLKDLDLNQLLISHSAATYLMRISGGEWRSYGIFAGDIIIVDRAISMSKNDLVVWWQGESFVISHLHQVPRNTPVWGTVTTAVHRFKETK